MPNGDDNKYSLMVSASLDLAKSTRNLQDDLDKIAPNLRLELQKVGIGTAGAQQLEKDIKQSVQKSTGGKGVEIDVTASSSSLMAMEKQMSLLRSKYGAIDSSVVRSADSGEAIAMTVKYTDAVGKAITQTFHWNEKKKELVTTTFREVDAEKQLILQMERHIAAAQKAMATTTQKDPRLPEVQAIKESATQLERVATEKKNIILQGGIVTPKEIDNVNQMRVGVDANVASMKALNNTAKSFGDLIKNNTIKVLEWMIATTAIYGSIRQLREGIGFISDLNKEMTNIQVVTGQTVEEVQALAVTYNQFAKELGTTTNEVARASLEFIRQGKTVEETQSLLRTSTMMSKLTALDAALATEYTTSIMNGFKLTAEEMVGVLDVLVDLDNKYATSVAEIALAMQRSSTSAQIAGVSLQELASYITIVSSVTRRSASSIGESFPDKGRGVGL